MDINKFKFRGYLLPILEKLVDSPFVTIDCEMSGVVTKNMKSGDRQTIQQRYAEVKEAAERYTILQIGLTCVSVVESEAVDATGRYIGGEPQHILYPFNFDVNPLIEEKLNIERIFSFQSGAVEFLMRHGFQIERPFVYGVPYLSRAEAKEAKRALEEYLTKSSVGDLQLGPGHPDALAFVEKTRAEILEWAGAPSNGSGDLQILSRNYPSKSTQARANAKDAVGELTRFEQRLVHQLTRAEFPKLITMGKNSRVIIKVKDEDKERQRLATKLGEADKAIHRQTGFRWIVDALSGRDLTHLTADMVAYDENGGRNEFNQRACNYGSRLDRVRDRTRGAQPVLVGHNMFTDLVYFYKTFVGDLPDTVEAFAQEIHELFPMIVDTKYLATHNCSDINPVSSLEDIDESLAGQSKPFIDLGPQHKMTSEQSLHEAGYDSYLTARVMIRLSAKLEAAGEYIVDNPSRPHSSSSPYQNAPITPTLGYPSGPLDPTSANFIPGSLLHHNSYADPLQNSLRLPYTEVAAPETLRNRAAQANTFEWLNNLPPDSIPEAPAPNRPPSPKEIQGRMPPFDADFWRVYGNKLRIFGTVETVLNLAPE